MSWFKRDPEPVVHEGPVPMSDNPFDYSEESLEDKALNPQIYSPIILEGLSAEDIILAAKANNASVRQMNTTEKPTFF